MAKRRDPARNLELEAAIVDAPLDPMPRIVYGDWLQTQGDIRGEWAAVMAGVEAEPDNIRLRAAAVAFLGKHRGALLGRGGAAMRGAYFGWRGGFVDEIRVAAGGPAEIAALWNHPSCRFVRHVAIGRSHHVDEVVRSLVAARPPLLDSLLVIDDVTEHETVELDTISELGSLHRLGLGDAHVSRPLPGLDELVLAVTARSGGSIQWLLAGGCPNVEELTLVRSSSSQAGTLAQVVAALPRLRRLRAIGFDGADELVAAVAGIADRLELLDLSHTDVSARALATLPARLPVLAVGTRPRTRVFEPPIDDDAASWLTHRLRTEGRDALRLIPGAGVALYNLGTNLLMAGDANAAKAIPLLDASTTLPSARCGTYPWANAAIAHERALHFDEVELRAREALLRAPNEPNFHAILLDALRRSGRLGDAAAAMPRALAALDAPPATGKHAGGAAACLGDCLLTLAQGGHHREVLKLAKRRAKLVGPAIEAIVAMSYVALGRLDDAKAAMMRARGTDKAVVFHARAVLLVAQGRKAAARAELARARAAGYPEWHWVARDPNLAELGVID